MWNFISTKKATYEKSLKVLVSVSYFCHFPCLSTDIFPPFSVFYSEGLGWHNVIQCFLLCICVFLWERIKNLEILKKHICSKKHFVSPTIQISWRWGSSKAGHSIVPQWIIKQIVFARNQTWVIPESEKLRRTSQLLTDEPLSPLLSKVRLWWGSFLHHIQIIRILDQPCQT